MTDALTIRPRIVTRLVGAPQLGDVFMLMACSRIRAGEPLESEQGFQYGKQLVVEWAEACRAIEAGKAEAPGEPDAIYDTDLHECTVVINFMGLLEPIDGLSFTDGGVLETGQTEIYRWIRERFERAFPGISDANGLHKEARDAALETFERYYLIRSSSQGGS